MKDRLDIQKKLEDIFMKRLKVDFTKDEEGKDESLFSNRIGLTPSELVYIYFDVRNEFNISIDKEYVINDGFTTFNNILNVICEISGI